MILFAQEYRGFSGKDLCLTEVVRLVVVGTLT